MTINVSSVRNSTHAVHYGNSLCFDTFGSDFFRPVFGTGVFRVPPPDSNDVLLAAGTGRSVLLTYLILVWNVSLSTVLSRTCLLSECFPSNVAWCLQLASVTEADDVYFNSPRAPRRGTSGEWTGGCVRQRSGPRASTAVECTHVFCRHVVVIASGEEQHHSESSTFKSLFQLSQFSFDCQKWSNRRSTSTLPLRHEDPLPATRNTVAESSQPNCQTIDNDRRRWSFQTDCRHVWVLTSVIVRSSSWSSSSLPRTSCHPSTPYHRSSTGWRRRCPQARPTRLPQILRLPCPSFQAPHPTAVSRVLVLIRRPIRATIETASLVDAHRTSSTRRSVDRWLRQAPAAAAAAAKRQRRHRPHRGRYASVRHRVWITAAGPSPSGQSFPAGGVQRTTTMAEARDTEVATDVWRAIRRIRSVDIRRRTWRTWIIQTTSPAGSRSRLSRQWRHRLCRLRRLHRDQDSCQRTTSAWHWVLARNSK